MFTSFFLTAIVGRVVPICSSNSRIISSSISIQLTLSYSPPGYAVMLSGKQYWKFDPLELTVLAGYPRSIGQDFFGCAAHQAIHPFFI